MTCGFILGLGWVMGWDGVTLFRPGINAGFNVPFSESASMRAVSSSVLADSYLSKKY